MDVKTPEISVLMPVYNNARFLREAIESILRQSFTNFEFIITDDGSTDASLRILQEYAAKDARIRLNTQANLGLTPTLNLMLRQAQGEFIARMDGDDIAMPDRFAQQVMFLQQHPEVVCVGGAFEEIDDRGRLLVHRQPPQTDPEIQKLALCGLTPINHPSMMMRKSVVMQIGGYDETFAAAQVLDLLLRLGEVGELANLETTVLKYRWHRKAISDSKQQLQMYNKRRACEKAWQRRHIEGTFVEPAEPWRPIDAVTRHHFMLKYGWQFFNQRQRSAAIAYALGAIKALPLGIEGWRLLACALIKPLPEVVNEPPA